MTIPTSPPCSEISRLVASSSLCPTHLRRHVSDSDSHKTLSSCSVSLQGQYRMSLQGLELSTISSGRRHRSLLMDIPTPLTDSPWRPFTWLLGEERNSHGEERGKPLTWALMTPSISYPLADRHGTLGIMLLRQVSPPLNKQNRRFLMVLTLW